MTYNDLTCTFLYNSLGYTILIAGISWSDLPGLCQIWAWFTISQQIITTKVCHYSTCSVLIISFILLLNSHELGKAGELIDSGDNTYGGKYVINPSGGLISKGHPLGATGISYLLNIPSIDKVKLLYDSYFLVLKCMFSLLKCLSGVNLFKMVHILLCRFYIHF